MFHAELTLSCMHLYLGKGFSTNLLFKQILFWNHTRCYVQMECNEKKRISGFICIFISVHMSNALPCSDKGQENTKIFFCISRVLVITKGNVGGMIWKWVPFDILYRHQFESWKHSLLVGRCLLHSYSLNFSFVLQRGSSTVHRTWGILSTNPYRVTKKVLSTAVLQEQVK